jgi:hypothetical protein
VAESYHWDCGLEYDPDEGVEALVRAAGHYVRASDDLRPRVLEAARIRCGEQWAQRCMRRLLMFLVLLACFTAADRHGLDSQRSGRTGILAAAGIDELNSPIAAATPRNGDGDWRMIDAFTELRRQQAEVVRLAL